MDEFSEYFVSWPGQDPGPSQAKVQARARARPGPGPSQGPVQNSKIKKAKKVISKPSQNHKKSTPISFRKYPPEATLASLNEALGTIWG